jgi:hypothetical protein
MKIKRQPFDSTIEPNMGWTNYYPIAIPSFHPASVTKELKIRLTSYQHPFNKGILFLLHAGGRWHS